MFKNNNKMMDVSLFLLRVVPALLFIEYGGVKLFGWFGGMGGGELPTLMLVAGIIEFFGGLALLLGFWVRPIALLASGQMAVAYFMGHALQGAWYAPLVNQGTPAVLFCFIFLFLAFHGAGKWSLGKNR